MAHKRKDTYTPSPEWWDHLRKEKRRVAKSERRAVKVRIKKESEEWPT
jgi:hypothetical protein